MQIPGINQTSYGLRSIKYERDKLWTYPPDNINPVQAGGALEAPPIGFCLALPKRFANRLMKLSDFLPPKAAFILVGRNEVGKLVLKIDYHMPEKTRG